MATSVGSGPNDRGPAWSPDGKKLLFTSDRNGAAELGDNSLGKGDLMLYDSIEGTHANLLTDELPIIGPRPAWKPLAGVETGR